MSVRVCIGIWVVALVSFAAAPLASAQSTTEPTAPDTTAPDVEPAGGDASLEERSDTLRFEPGISLLAGYEYLRRDVADVQHSSDRFVLDRVHVSLRAARGELEARLLLEAVPSANEGALIGVAGASLLMRLREAWFGYAPVAGLSFQAGVVPTLIAPALERQDGLRDIGRTPLEALDLEPMADLGLRARYELPHELASLSLGAFAGDGYTAQELNDAKAMEALLTFSAGGSSAVTHPLTLTLGARRNRRGAAGTRDTRLHGALAWVAPRVGGGVGFSYLLGLEGDGARRGTLLTLHANAEPIDRLLLGARFFRFMRDLDHADDHWMRLEAAAGVRVVEGLKLWLVARKSWPGARTRDVVGGSDEFALRLMLAGNL